MNFGAVAQLGERMTGSHEVVGSTPIGSTNERAWLFIQAFLLKGEGRLI